VRLPVRLGRPKRKPLLPTGAGERERGDGDDHRHERQPADPPWSRHREQRSGAFHLRGERDVAQRGDDAGSGKLGAEQLPALGGVCQRRVAALPFLQGRDGAERRAADAGGGELVRGGAAHRGGRGAVGRGVGARQPHGARRPRAGAHGGGLGWERRAGVPLRRLRGSQWRAGVGERGGARGRGERAAHADGGRVREHAVEPRSIRW